MGSDLVGTQEIEPLSHDEKTTPSEDESSHHVEKIASSDANLVYDHNEEEPELHARTYIAVLAMFLMNFAQLFGLQGPPVVVSSHFISIFHSSKLTQIAYLDWRKFP